MPDFLTLRAEELWHEGKKFLSKKNKFWYMKHHFQFARQILKTNDQLIFGSKSMKARHNTNSWKISLWHKKKFLSKNLYQQQKWIEHLHYLNFEMIIVWSERNSVWFKIFFFMLLHSFFRFFVYWWEIHIKNIKWIFLSHTFLRYVM